MAEITIDQTEVAVEVTDTAVNVLPIVSQVVIETATSATLAVVDPINYDNATIGLNIGNNLTVVSGDLTTTQVLDDIDKIAFDTAAGATAAVGELAWNDTDGTLNLGLKGGNVTLQIGQELVQLVKDADNAGITNGAAYYLVGSDGSNVTVRKALASGEATSSKTFGIATEASSGGAKAFLTTFGMVRDIDTSALTEGAIVWLSPTVAGGLTTTKPSAPNHAVMLGLCVRSHAVNGMVFVSVNNGYELEELHDVAITSVANNDLIAYDSATSLWKNVQLSTLGDSRYARLGAANAFTVGGHTITNAVDSTVALVLNAHASQSSDVFQVKDSGGGIRAQIYNNFNWNISGALQISQRFTSYGHSNFSSSAGSVPLLVRGAASQSADLTQWQNSAGTVLAKVTASGTFAAGENIIAGATSGAIGRSTVYTGAAAIIGAVIRGAASQSANLLELQNSSGGILAQISASGDLRVAQDYGRILQAFGGATLQLTKMTQQTGNPGANNARLYFRDGTTAGTLKLVVRAGAAGAETTILDNIPQ